ncbi:hypothetical protein B5S32_g1255 [[Candida] boidinii]|nr:hypothetical protein B5S32_g1255 [[Candida] boidinii]
MALLHMIETVKRPIPSDVLLLYWPFHIILLAILLTQEWFSIDFKPIRSKIDDQSFEIGLMTILFLNACIIYYLEWYCYEPAEELEEYYHEKDLDINPPNILSRLTFSWMNKLIDTGYRNNGLEMHDLPAPPEIVLTEHSAPILAKHWDHELKKSQTSVKKYEPSLMLAIGKTFGFLVASSLVFDMGDSIISFLQPQLLRLLIKYFARDDDPPIVIGFGISICMFLITLCEAAFYNQYVIKTVQAGLGVKASLMSLVYTKAMKLSPEAKLERTTGDIINHMAVDVVRIEDTVQYVQTLFSAPTRLILCLYSLYSLLGNATWAGIVTMCIMMPINTVLVKSLRKNHKKQMKLKDARTQMVAEILSNIKSIKVYAWEKPMLERLSELRNDQELKNLYKIGVLSAIVNFAWTCVPFFVSCSTFAIFAFTSDTPLTPEIVFPALSLFDLLSDPIFAIPALMTAMIESGVALNRLVSFLLADEIVDTTVQRLPRVSKKGDVSVSITNSTFLWSSPKDNKIYNNFNEVENSSIALKNIDFKAKKGELSCIVGRVGAGKSTFLQSILGELYTISADWKKGSPVVTICGSVSYCSQVPWILNATFKENILFGAKFDPEFYQKTIEACDLLPDIEKLPDGDDTQVGEKGISLSGGQKARLSLARAVYARSDIYLLDDVLSAVDTHVGQKLVDMVLSDRGLLATKTRILATNSVNVLREAKQITLLENKTISERGNYKQVINQKGSLYKLIKEFGKDEDIAQTSSSTSAAQLNNDEIVTEEYKSDEASSIASSSSSSISFDENNELKEGEFDGIKPFDGTADDTEAVLRSFVRTGLSNELTKIQSNNTLRRASLASLKKNALVVDKYQSNNSVNNGETVERKTAKSIEKKEKGSVKWSVYLNYAKACSSTGIMVVTLMVFLTVGLSVSGNYWLKHWSESNSKNGSNKNVLMYVGVYALFGIGSGVATLVRAIVMWSWCSIRGARILHNKLAYAVIRSPMSFFETTPMGRILNRFSQDMSKIDSTLPRVFVAVFNAVVKTFFTFMIIGYNVPLFFVIMLFLSIIYIVYQRYYIVSSRDLKRLVSISKSPIFAHIQESLNGSETVRAYGQNNRFLHQNSINIDTSQVPLYNMKSVNRWLSTRLQVIGSVIIFATSSLALSSSKSASPLSAGLVGLVMSYALRITGSLSFIVKRSVEVESNVVCCERIFEYCDLKPENYEASKESVPVKTIGWPNNGDIKFENYSTKYRENLDPVLNGINLEIKPKEKIGVVGRTGAGKSTLTLALFRIIEATGGNISIDGVDTSKISLFDLRHNLSIIPQDSQAIGGTVRQNLDPLNEYTDDELWKALEMAHLKDHIISMIKVKEEDGNNETEAAEQTRNETESETTPLLNSANENYASNMSDVEIKKAGLDVIIAESGANLSVGQRQLLCLARVLLKPSKILVLDEATAAVDFQTDKFIQETIRTSFKDKTIITIAHRIDTVMNSDRILVLDKGKIEEFDSPSVLLKNKEGLFYKLCENGGYLN